VTRHVSCQTSRKFSPSLDVHDKFSMSSAEDKKAKAEARKAKLLSKGGDRLAKITGQGRPGEDFEGV
jgi:hypothetical protein